MMCVRRLGLTLFLSLGLLGPATALTTFEQTLTSEQQARYRGLIHEQRCLVCQNQTIADSNAELAQDLRRQVHDRILAGQSDQEIRDYVTQRYGDFVLYKPPIKARTLALWLGPAVLVLLGLFTVWRFSRRQTAGPIKQSVDGERLKRLLEDER